MKTLFKYLTESNSKEKQEFVELRNKSSTSDKEVFFTEMRSSDINSYKEIADIRTTSTLISSKFEDWPKEVQDIVISYYEKD
jgi:hypothetical protein